MRFIMQSFCVLILFAAALALGRCGRKSNHKTEIVAPAFGPYVPADWDGEGDWSQNALKVEDITP